MRIGLIARREGDRGLSIQCRGFYENMPVARTLLVTGVQTIERRPFDYPGAIEARYDPRQHSLDEGIVREFLSGLDVVFTVETPYDWRLLDWAREMGVATVIQGNPEFFRHGQAGYEHYSHPSAWWWPTSWRLEHLPPGPVVPVPMPDRPVTAADPKQRPLSVLHVVGKRAHGDRNGTDIVCSAVAAMRSNIHLTMYGLDGQLPETRRNPHVVVERFVDGADDRWAMYEGQHLLILPRRYAGLSLVALEAAACGVAVLMPQCSPNEELASTFVVPRRFRSMSLPCGPIDVAEVNHLDLAAEVDRLAYAHGDLANAQAQAYHSVPRWSTMRDVYLNELGRACDG